MVDLFCCLGTPLLILGSMTRTMASARQRGHNLFVWMMIHLLICGSSLSAGIMAGLFVGFLQDPYMDASKGSMPIAVGGMLGCLFGILLMILTTSLLPRPYEHEHHLADLD